MNNDSLNHSALGGNYWYMQDIHHTTHIPVHIGVHTQNTIGEVQDSYPRKWKMFIFITSCRRS